MGFQPTGKPLVKPRMRGIIPCITKLFSPSTWEIPHKCSTKWLPLNPLLNHQIIEIASWEVYPIFRHTQIPQVFCIFF